MKSSPDHELAQLLGRGLHAAKCAGGTSPSAIKSLVLKIIEANRLNGIVLDYGAGKGELLGLLKTYGMFERLIGADILDNPMPFDQELAWYQQDLNLPLEMDELLPNVVICTEVIEYLENPRAVF